VIRSGWNESTNGFPSATSNACSTRFRGADPTEARHGPANSNPPLTGIVLASAGTASETEVEKRYSPFSCPPFSLPENSPPLNITLAMSPNTVQRVLN
jgi:hypothetical protein